MVIPLSLKTRIHPTVFDNMNRLFYYTSLLKPNQLIKTITKKCFLKERLALAGW